MPTIVAVCPYCRAGGVRAPESALGSSANCPKCGSSFTVMPSEGAPGWGSKANAPAAPSQPIAAPSPRTATPPSSPPSRPTNIEETKPTAAMSDVTEPSTVDDVSKAKKKKKRSNSSSTESEIPVAVARPPVQKSAPAPTPAMEPAPASSPRPVVESESDDDDTVTDFGLVVALSSLALVGVAVLASLFPFGRVIAAVLAGLGLLGGISSLGAEGRAKAAGGLAIGLHFLVLVVVLIFPSWLNLDPWSGSGIENTPPAPQAWSHSKQTASLAQWVDSSSASWQYRDVRATILSATSGPIDLFDAKGMKRPSKEHYLQLVVRVKNIGVERPLDLSGWTVGQNVDLVHITDSAGRTINPAAFEEGWNPEPQPKPPEKLYPWKTSDVRLIFSAPQPRIDYLRVSLPGTTFGFEEEIKFQIDSGALILTGLKKK